jgi:hypothetical protein
LRARWILWLEPTHDDEAVMNGAQEFRRNWSAEILKEAPMIAPARQYVWPMRIAGEEDALARGALQVMVRPASGGQYMVTCALGFRDPAMPTGIFACPDADEICAVAGGYAYVARVDAPEQCTLLGMKPVVEVHAAGQAGVLLFVGFQTILAWGSGGVVWETGRLSWEGVRVTSVSGNEVRGMGWDLRGDVEVEFTVDLRTGMHTGGGFRV